jgi:hypothetical protein
MRVRVSIAAAALVVIPSCAGVFGLDEVAEVARLEVDAQAPVSEASDAPTGDALACAIAPFDARFDPALPAFGWDEELGFARRDELALAVVGEGLEVKVTPGGTEARGRYLREQLSGGTCFELRLRIQITTTPTVGGVFFAVLRFGTNSAFVLGLRPDQTFVAGQQDTSLPGTPFTVLGNGKVVQGATHEVRVRFDVGPVQVLLDGAPVPLDGQRLRFESADKLDVGVIYADPNAATTFVIQEAKLLTSR